MFFINEKPEDIKQARSTAPSLGELVSIPHFLAPESMQSWI